MKRGLRSTRAGGCRCWVWLALLPVLAAADPPSLYGLLDQRLELMDEVAAYKWQHRLPVEDPEREALVVQQAVADGLRYGLRPDSSERLFRAQIEAAKEIQRHHFEIWQRSGGPATAPDLNATVRPELLRLGAAITEAVSRQAGPPRAADFLAEVDVAGLGTERRGALLAALAGVEVYGNRLEQILDSGTLRVGTTGDYPPFSHRGAEDQAIAGIDIDLAQHLADALGVSLVFVPTSWPRLLDDLAAGRYDIAMSGVSRTLERQKRGYLSVGYHAGGKTPIARCEDVARFADLAAIDRPGVRVIVNPGGTNEAFVDTHIRQAEKHLHDDNRSIFLALVERRADVMITDRVEVSLQARQHPELCATMADNLTYQEKAYLLPRDEPWRAFVDTWLQLAVGEGVVQRTFRHHGVEAHLPGF